MRPFLYSVLLFSALNCSAQDNYYNSRQYQTNQYKSLSSATSRAYTIPDRPYNRTFSNTGSAPSTSTSSSPGKTYSTISPSTGTGSKGYSDIGAYDKVRRQEEAGKQQEERYKANLALLSASIKKYSELIADHGNAKTEADHYDLLLRGMRAGIDLTAVFNVIGRDIAAYHAKFGNRQGITYKNSAAIFQEAYTKSYNKELTKMLNGSNDAYSKFFFLKEIVKTDPSFENYFSMAENALASKQFDDARNGFSIAHSKNPLHFAALVGYGDALMMLSEMAEAENQYRKALAINESNADLLLKTAWINFLQAKKEEAYELAKSAAALVPNEAGPYLFLAALQAEGKDRAMLLENANAVQNTIKIGKLGDMLFSYAKYLQSEKANEASLIFLDLAVSENPKSFDYLEVRYGTNKLLGRGKQAAIDLQLMEKL